MRSSRSRFLFAHDLFGKPLHTFPDHALALTVGVGVPVAPADIGEAAEVRAHRTPALLLMGRDALLGFGDLARQHVDRLLRLADPVMTHRETGDLELLQRGAVLLDLRPMPGDLAVAVDHRKSSDSRSTYH